MKYIKWDNSLSVNILSIDIQHQKLIDEINRFYENLGNKRNNDVLSDILFQLNRYSISHFKTEEVLMKKFGYKGYLDHKKEHDAFIAKINEIEKKLKEGKMVLTIEVAVFLKDWLSNHIAKTDKAYSQYLNSCGIK